MQKTTASLKFLGILLLSSTFLFLGSCKKKIVKSNLAGMTSFSISSLPVQFKIDEAKMMISNSDSLPFGTDVSSLAPEFTAVPKSTVNVGGVEQVSGTTVNDFSSPVTYSVVAEDGATTRNYSVLVNVTKVDPKTIAWQQITIDGGWGNFHSVSAVAYNSKFYMIGASMGAFGAFDFTSNVSDDGTIWTRTRAVDNEGDSVPNVESPAFINFDSKIWILGGHRPGVGFAFDDVTNKVWSSKDGANWTVSEPADPANRWEKRERISSVVFKNKLWVIGGNSYPPFGNSYSPGTAFNDIWSSSNGVDWTEENANPTFIARTNPAVFVYNDKIWMVGGRDNGGKYLDEVWNSADGITWNEVTTNSVFTGRAALQVVVNKDELILVGGEDSTSVLGDMWISENAGVDWKLMEPGKDVRALPASFKARSNFSMFKSGDNLYIFGGVGAKDGTENYTYLNDLWKGKLQ